MTKRRRIRWALLAGTVIAVAAGVLPLAAHAASTGPTAPVGLTVARSSTAPTEFDIAWKPVDGVDHYNVSVFDGTQDTVTTVPADTTTLHVKGSSNPCTQYRIDVGSRDADGLGATSGYVWMHPLAPGAVTSMVASRSTSDHTKATASWAAPAWLGYGKFGGYKVQTVRISDGAIMSTRTSADTVEAVGGLDPAKQYVVKVWAANAYGTCATARGLIGNQHPGSPARFIVSRDPGVPAILRLSWTAPAWSGYSPVDGYLLGYGDSRITTWIKVTGTKAELNLTPNLAHVFQVRAFNSSGAGSLTRSVGIARYGVSGSAAVPPTVTMDESAGIVTITTVGPVGSSSLYPRLLMKVVPSTGTGYSDSQYAQNGASTVQFNAVPCGTYTITVDGVGTTGTAQFARKVVNRCDQGATGAAEWKTTYGSAVVKDGGEAEMSKGSENRIVLNRKRSSSDMAVTTTATLKSGAGYAIWLRASLTSSTAVSGYAVMYDPAYAKLDAGFGPAFVLRHWYNGKECGTLLAKTKIPAWMDLSAPHKVVAVAKGNGMYVTVDNFTVFDFPAVSKLVAASPCKFPAPAGLQIGLRSFGSGTVSLFEHTTVDD